MIEHCKQACKFLAEVKKEKIFQLILNKWSILDEVLKILRVAFVATKQLQLTSLTLSDFFACWLRIKLQLTKFIKEETPLTNFASIFMEKLLSREKELLNYPAMLSAIYLDSRYRNELKNPEHIEIAKRTLANQYERILSHRPTPQTEVQPETEIDSFEEYLRQSDETFDTSSVNVSNANVETFNRLAFMEMLQNYEKNEPRKHHTVSLLEDWETLKMEYPELYQLATIIFGIPPTQVSVERSFSAMAFIFNPKRAQLAQEMLENILIIKLNKDLVTQINDRDMNELRN